VALILFWASVRECHQSPDNLHVIALRRVLMWKYEDGPEDAVDDGDPNDVGPAWLDTFEEDERLSSEKVADGEWILGPRRNALPLRTATNSK